MKARGSDVPGEAAPPRRAGRLEEGVLPDAVWCPGRIEDDGDLHVLDAGNLPNGLPDPVDHGIVKRAAVVSVIVILTPAPSISTP